MPEATASGILKTKVAQLCAPAQPFHVVDPSTNQAVPLAVLAVRLQLVADKQGN